MLLLVKVQFVNIQFHVKPTFQKRKRLLAYKIDYGDIYVLKICAVVF